MLFPIRHLISGREKPLCVLKDTKVGDALAIMVEHDYSQLPITDENGNLSGIITEQSIISTYFHTRGTVSLLDLNVDHCQTTPAILSPDKDIFEALGMLKNVYAIIVVQDKKPVGIITDYDTTQFFTDISGGLILVEDVEVSLRQYIENIYTNENALKAALIKAFGTSKREQTEPAQHYDELTLSGYINLVTADGNWQKFEDYLKPKNIFIELMNQVRQIRNQLTHFRGRLEPIQYDALSRARDWLSSRPKVNITLEVQSVEHIQIVESITLKQVDKYSPLYDWLLRTRFLSNYVRVTFDDLERILGEPLPSSAQGHRSWWDNDYLANPQSLAWLRAGWRVRDVDLSGKEVDFQKTNQVLMQLFFADLLEQLKSTRPGLTNATKTYPQNWWSFGAGKSGYSFGWTFTGHNTLRVEFYIDVGDKRENKASFDALFAQKVIIEEELGFTLNWDRLDNKRASRIFAEKPLKITDSAEKLEQAKRWVLETTLKFVDVFQHRIKGQ